MFKCEWFDVQHVGTGYKVDSYSITSVKANRRLNTDEPFILACQAEQVFYVEDPNDQNWLVVMKNYPRDLYNMPTQMEDDVYELDEDNDIFQEEDNDICGRATTPLDNDDEVGVLNRIDVDAEEVPIEIVQQIEQYIGQDLLLPSYIDDDDNTCNGDFVNESENECNEYDSDEN